MTDVLERYRAMLETPSVFAVDPSALLRDMAAEIEQLRSPPLRAREEIARIIWNGFAQKMGGDFDSAKGTVAYDHCCGVADALLSRTAGQEWRDISSLPDRTKVGTVWKTLLDDKIFATLESRWEIDLPAPPVAEPIVAEKGTKL